MTATRPKTTTKRTVQQPAEVTDQGHLDAIEILREKCFELKFSIGRLPTSRKAEKGKSEAIAKMMGGSRKGIRTSWSLFLESHPRVKELNAVLADLQSYRDSFAVMEDSKKAGAKEKEKEGDGPRTSQEGGKRLVWADDHDQVYDRVVELAGRVTLAAQRVQEALPQIKANDRKEAGELWEESAYPTDLVSAVGVPKDAAGHYIVDFAPTVAVPPGLAPQIKEQVINRAMSRLSGSLEITVEAAVKGLNEGLSTFMSELVNRVRIFPEEGHEFEAFCRHGAAEVIKTKVHDQDRTIPVGSVMLYLQYKDVAEGESDAAPDKLETVKKWVGPIAEKEYRVKVRPQETGERKKIYPTVIEGLIARMQEFREKQSSLLGDHGKNVDGAFTALFDTFTEMRRLGEDNNKVGQKVAGQLRVDPDFKKTVAEVVADTIEALDNSVAEVKKVRRRISAKMIGKV